LSSNGSIPEDAIFDPNDPEDRLHKQDWNKTTADKDTWAHQERRKMHGWSNTDVATYKHMTGRRGSVFSMWAPGKDKDGNDILAHNDDMDRVDGRSESGRSEGARSDAATNTLSPGSPKQNNRRGSNLSDRRGSILSMWKGGKDAQGNHIMDDDEEWAR
jgi:hypothetical protein